MMTHQTASMSFRHCSGLLLPGRDHLVEHAAVLSLRQGPWKLIEAGKGPRVLANTNTETGQADAVQLYNLEEDLGETNNVAAQHPDRVRKMHTLLDAIRHGTRSARQVYGKKGPLRVGP